MDSIKPMQGTFDVLIIGAGPSGVATAYCLRNSGLTVAILDKATFPREKICGDGLTLDVIQQLAAMSPELGDAFHAFSGKLSCSGAEIFAPSGNQVTLPVRPAGEKKQMFTCRRKDFDYFLIQQLKVFSNITIFEGCIPEKIEIFDNGVFAHTNLGTFQGRMAVGADGVNSFTARQMNIKRISPEHQCVAMRTYYRGLKPLTEGNPIEMYLPKEILPGYLWIFHLADGTANVGIGILASVIREKKINLKKLFQEILLKEPLLSRLKTATQLEPVKGLIIPLGGEQRVISGEKFLLTGDAATLVDPITGEGVANALRSGRIAADHIRRCHQENNFGAAFNQAYDHEIYRRMMPEFRLHLTLRKLLNHPKLLNVIIGAASKHPKTEAGLHQIMWNLDGSTTWKKAKTVLKIFWLFTFRNLLFPITKKSQKTNSSL